MERKIGNRLALYRKKYGYSQEELAFKLDVSRQAVSKRERDEALPDTNNLLSLSEIYGISVDTLLNKDPAIVDEGSVEEESDAIEIVDNHKEKEESVVSQGENKKMIKLSEIITGCLILLVTIIYLILGFTLKDNKGWSIYWTLYFVPFVISSIFECIGYRKVSKFNIVFLCCFIYLFVGMSFGMWHPTWVIYFAIPLFYGIVEPIEISIKIKASKH